MADSKHSIKIVGLCWTFWPWWKRLTTNFQGHSRNLCNALAAVARRLSTEFIDPEGIKAPVACRLIPLNKNPGVRPIGVCETVRWIIGKTVLAVIKSEILSATGALQLCAGQNAGCEAAIHALNSLYLDDSTEAILLVDATNAFNSLNRQVALKNISLNCPTILLYWLTLTDSPLLYLSEVTCCGLAKVQPKAIHSQWPCTPSHYTTDQHDTHRWYQSSVVRWWR